MGIGREESTRVAGAGIYSHQRTTSWWLLFSATSMRTRKMWAMSFYLNRSNSNGIPDDIYQVIMACESEIKGNWRISLIADPQNDIWQFKLDPEHGKQRTCNLLPESQNVRSVRQALRMLTD